MIQTKDRFQIAIDNVTELETILNAEQVFKKNKKEYLENLAVLKKKLSDQEYSVAIIAAMKAGKSTLINAFLGNDILPNESDACTASITEIKHAPTFIEKVRKIYKNGSVIDIFATEEFDLGEAFHADVKKSRNSNEIDKILKYEINSPIIAVNDLNSDSSIQKFLLVDTPGTNEAQLDEQVDITALKENTYYQLRNANAVIFVFDFTSYKSETNVNLLNDIFAGREDLKKDLDKVFFVLNKIDMRTEKDGDIPNILANVKELIKTATKNVIDSPNVIPVSALKALQGRRLVQNNITEKDKKELETKYAGPYGQEVEIDGDILIRTLKGEKLGTALFEDSMLPALEKEVIVNTFKNATESLYKESLSILNGRLEKLTDFIQNEITLTEINYEEKEAQIKQSEEDIQKLKKYTSPIKERVETLKQQYETNVTSVLKSVTYKMENALSDAVSNYNVEYKFNSKEEAQETSSKIQESVTKSLADVSSEVEDKLTRLYEEFQIRLKNESVDIFNKVAQEADKILEQQLNLKIESAGYVDTQEGKFNYQLDSRNVEITERKAEVDNDGFLAGGFGGAVAGIAALRVLGVPGIIAGAALGFAAGAILTEIDAKDAYIVNKNQFTDKVLTDNRSKIQQLEIKIKEQTEKEIQFVEDSIITSVNRLLDAITESLQRLETNRQKTQQQKSEEIAALKKIQFNLQQLKL